MKSKKTLKLFLIGMVIVSTTGCKPKLLLKDLLFRFEDVSGKEKHDISRLVNNLSPV